jgi:hypothetical protein
MPQKHVHARVLQLYLVGTNSSLWIALLSLTLPRSEARTRARVLQLLITYLDIPILSLMRPGKYVF